MKIAFLCRYYNKSNRGAETYVSELSKRLGSKVSIHETIFDRVDNNTEIIISTNGRLDAILAKLWCVIHGKKLIISGQSGFGWDDKLNLWLFPNVFIALTNYQKLWAKKINPFVRVEVIPNGVDLQKFNPKVKPMETNLKKPIILCVGAVVTSKIGEISKRQKLLISAAQKIGASVLLVGKGGDMEKGQKDMPNVYTACNLFSYPTSERESFGIAMLEAMASGLAVVVTDDPIRREIIGDAGLFVDPTDTAKYSKALEEALKTDWQNKPRLQAEKFSWDKVAKQYEELFHTL